MTPQEAERERLAQREQDRAEQQRNANERRRIAELARQRLLNEPPQTSNDRSDLDDIAFNIHNSYDWGGRGDQCVTAVVRETDGTLVVFAQRYMETMSDYARTHYAAKSFRFKSGCPHHHLHAEMYAILNYLQENKRPADSVREIGVSKWICPDCAAALDHLGIVYTKSWVTAVSSSHWVDPFEILPPTCKPPVERRRDDDDDGPGPGRGRSLGSATSSAQPIHV